MIYLYTGTPGSGKSFHSARDIVFKTKRKDKNKVIGNFPVTIKHQDNYIYKDNYEITPQFLKEYAYKNHVKGKEGQTLLILDEAQIIFNSRDWQSAKSNRMDWIIFMSQHRHFGYNIILITQFDRMIDRQIRCLVEYEVLHLKVNNFFWFIPGTTFLCIERWYGQKMKVGHYMFRYSKKIAKIYDSYSIFNHDEQEGGVGVPSPASVVENT